jgi:hypothetical protein
LEVGLKNALRLTFYSIALFIAPAFPQGEDPWYATAKPDSSTSLLFPFKKGDLYGYKDQLGKIVIKPRFIYADYFYPEGSAPVIDSKGSGYIDLKGRLRFRAYLFENGPDPFFEGYARYIEKGKLGFIDRRLKRRIPAQFGDAFPFRDGWTSYCVGCERAMLLENRKYAKAGQVQKGKWGLMDTTGFRITPPIYGAIQIMNSDTAKACIECTYRFDGEHSIVSDGKWILLNRKGSPIP